MSNKKSCQDIEKFKKILQKARESMIIRPKKGLTETLSFSKELSNKYIHNLNHK